MTLKNNSKVFNAIDSMNKILIILVGAGAMFVGFFAIIFYSIVGLSGFEVAALTITLLPFYVTLFSHNRGKYYMPIYIMLLTLTGLVFISMIVAIALGFSLGTVSLMELFLFMMGGMAFLVEVRNTYLELNNAEKNKAAPEMLVK